MASLEENSKCKAYMCLLHTDCIGHRRIVCSREPLIGEKFKTHLNLITQFFDTDKKLHRFKISREEGLDRLKSIDIVFDYTHIDPDPDRTRTYYCINTNTNTFAVIDVHLPEYHLVFYSLSLNRQVKCNGWIPSTFKYYLAMKRIARNPIVKQYVARKLDELWRPGGKFALDGWELCKSLVPVEF